MEQVQEDLALVLQQRRHRRPATVAPAPAREPSARARSCEASGARRRPLSGGVRGPPAWSAAPSRGAAVPVPVPVPVPRVLPCSAQAGGPREPPVWKMRWGGDSAVLKPPPGAPSEVSRAEPLAFSYNEVGVLTADVRPGSRSSL